MNVAFFYPLAWLGALAVAAPLWLHLHRRRETNLVRFSALRFLDDQPVARRRPLWPRDWPLLLLRILGVLLLAAAFAWPYLPDFEADDVVTESVVYVLDNTLSHQAGDGFPKARDALAQRLSSAGRGQQSAVVELNALPRVVGTFSDDPAMLARSVAALEPAAARGSYLAACREAAELLRGSLGAQRRLVLLTDNQTNQWDEGRDTPPFLANVQLELPPAPPAATRPNLAVWNARAQRLLLGASTLVQCSFDLFHQGPARTARLEILVDGQSLGERDVPLEPTPAVVTQTLEWASNDTGWLRGEVRISGTPDALPGDDRVVFAVPPLRAGTVDLLVQSKFLRTALAPEILQGRWEVRTLDLDRWQLPPSPADVLCSEASRLQAGVARDYLLQQLNQGRGVLLVLDDVSPAIAAFLRSLGLDIGSAVALQSNDCRLKYYLEDHPLFLPFRSGDFGELSQVTVQRYFPVTIERGQPLIFARDGQPIFWNVPAKGTLLVAAFAFDRTHTNWPTLASFVPFLDMALEQARPAPPSVEPCLPGEAFTWHVAPERTAGEVELRALGSDQVLERVAVAGGMVRLSAPAATGLYALHYRGETDPAAMLAVNPSPDESRLAYTDPGEVAQRWRIRQEEQAVAPVESSRRVRSEVTILQQRLWWWLLLAGAAALCFETGWLAYRERSP